MHASSASNQMHPQTRAGRIQQLWNTFSKWQVKKRLDREQLTKALEDMEFFECVESSGCPDSRPNLVTRLMELMTSPPHNGSVEWSNFQRVMLQLTSLQPRRNRRSSSCSGSGNGPRRSHSTSNAARASSPTPPIPISLVDDDCPTAPELEPHQIQQLQQFHQFQMQQLAPGDIQGKDVVPQGNMQPNNAQGTNSRPTRGRRGSVTSQQTVSSAAKGSTTGTRGRRSTTPTPPAASTRSSSSSNWNSSRRRSNSQVDRPGTPTSQTGNNRGRRSPSNTSHSRTNGRSNNTGRTTPTIPQVVSVDVSNAANELMEYEEDEAACGYIPQQQFPQQQQIQPQQQQAPPQDQMQYYGQPQNIVLGYNQAGIPQQAVYQQPPASIPQPQNQQQAGYPPQQQQQQQQNQQQEQQYYQQQQQQQQDTQSECSTFVPAHAPSFAADPHQGAGFYSGGPLQGQQQQQPNEMFYGGGNSAPPAAPVEQQMYQQPQPPPPAAQPQQHNNIINDPQEMYGQMYGQEITAVPVGGADYQQQQPQRQQATPTPPPPPPVQQHQQQILQPGPMPLHPQQQLPHQTENMRGGNGPVNTPSSVAPTPTPPPLNPNTTTPPALTPPQSSVNQPRPAHQLQETPTSTPPPQFPAGWPIATPTPPPVVQPVVGVADTQTGNCVEPTVAFPNSSGSAPHHPLQAPTSTWPPEPSPSPQPQGLSMGIVGSSTSTLQSREPAPLMPIPPPATTSTASIISSTPPAPLSSSLAGGAPFDTILASLAHGARSSQQGTSVHVATTGNGQTSTAPNAPIGASSIKMEPSYFTTTSSNDIAVNTECGPAVVDPAIADETLARIHNTSNASSSASNNSGTRPMRELQQTSQFSRKVHPSIHTPVLAESAQELLAKRLDNAANGGLLTRDLDEDLLQKKTDKLLAEVQEKKKKVTMGAEYLHATYGWPVTDATTAVTGQHTSNPPSNGRALSPVGFTSSLPQYQTSHGAPQNPFANTSVLSTPSCPYSPLSSIAPSSSISQRELHSSQHASGFGSGMVVAHAVDYPSRCQSSPPGSPGCKFGMPKEQYTASYPYPPVGKV
eukprot:TRINITY_DN66428_c4_g1_i1.p1 TRINITY_DN66428_c4_g1~~TRINITY_DN66428_c4_g1_i1.p1  ORF type:complete len:1070 (+),score=224.52 TRINITY_DN66428_c4_g1_i1:119-3328(+)